MSYRFGFNGQEKSDEIAGAGNHTTAPFWECDSRLGRRWNIDPIVKPWESGYATFANNPIWYSDPQGLVAKNGHEQEVKDRTADRDKAKGALDAIKSKSSSLDPIDKSAMKAYKSELKTVEKALNSAENRLAYAQEKFDKVEQLLTEYAFYDPTGYAYVDNLKDPDGQTVDVYFAVDESLVGSAGGYDANGQFQFASGIHGKTDIGARILRLDGKITDQIVKSQKYGENTVYVPLLSKTTDVTIAHEKHHIYFFIMNLPNKTPDDLDEAGAQKAQKDYLKTKTGKGGVPAGFKRQ